MYTHLEDEGVGGWGAGFLVDDEGEVEVGSIDEKRVYNLSNLESMLATFSSKCFWWSWK